MKTKNIKQWHKIITERDGFVCQYCKKDFSAGFYFDENGINQYVCGHHLLRRRNNPEMVLETDIGKTTCKDCHYKIHSGIISDE